MLKYLFFIFTASALGVAAHATWAEAPHNPFADGHLVCPPLPPAMQAAEPALLPPPKLEHLAAAAPPQTIAAAKIEIYEPQASSERMVETRQADESDWGLARGLMEYAPRELAMLIQPKLAEPVPVNMPPADAANVLEPATPPSTDGESSGPAVAEAAQQSVDAATQLLTSAVPDAARPAVPNLYLPEGALNEEGAQLTLIRHELKLYELPDITSPESPFTLRNGDKVRPLTRLRNEQDFDWIKVQREGRSWWAQAEYFIRVDPRNSSRAGIKNLSIGEEAVDRDSALPPDYAPDDLAELDRQYAFDPREQRLRREVCEAFARMADDAARKGLKLRVFSSYRDFAAQKKLYLEAIEKDGPKQNGVAAPGYSEHQLGTTIDVSNTDRRMVLSGRFGETSEGRWLHENAARFGFRNSYTNENTEQVGYKPEPWHLRYVGVKNAQPTDIAKR